MSFNHIYTLLYSEKSLLYLFMFSDMLSWLKSFVDHTICFQQCSSEIKTDSNFDCLLKYLLSSYFILLKIFFCFFLRHLFSFVYLQDFSLALTCSIKPFVSIYGVHWFLNFISCRMMCNVCLELLKYSSHNRLSSLGTNFALDRFC